MDCDIKVTSSGLKLLQSDNILNKCVGMILNAYIVYIGHGWERIVGGNVLIDSQMFHILIGRKYYGPLTRRLI